MNKKAQFFEVITLIFTGIALFTIFTALTFKYDFFDTGGIGMYAGGLINTYQNQEESLMALDLLISDAADKTLIKISADGGMLSHDCGLKIYYQWNDGGKECFPAYKNNALVIFEGLLNKSLDEHQTFLLGKNFNLDLQQTNRTMFTAVSSQKLKTPIEVSKSLSKQCETSILGKRSISYSEAEDYIKQNYPDSALAKDPNLIRLVLDEGDDRGIDASFVLGFFKQESWFGKSDISMRTNNPGNIRPFDDCGFTESMEYSCLQQGGRNCRVTGQCACAFVDCNPVSGCFCGFPDWETGILAWFNLMERVYISQGRTSLETIIPKYAPDSDKYGGNNEAAYIMNVQEFVSRYKNIPCKVQLGEYSYLPSSKARKDYNLTWFDMLIDFSRETIDDCDDNTSNCVLKKMDEFNQGLQNNQAGAAGPQPMTMQDLTFYKGCEAEPDEVFFEFIENLNDCSQTTDDECICRLNEKNTTPSRQHMNFTYDKTLNGYKHYNITLESTNATSFFVVEEDVWMPLEYRYIHDSKGEFGGKYILFEDGQGQFYKAEDFDNLYMVKSASKTFMAIEDGGKMYDAQGQELQVPGDRCNIVRKNFNFCFSTGKYFLDVEDGLEKRSADIKFGLTLTDRMPPQLFSVVAEDMPGKANSLLLKWTLPEYAQTNEFPEDVVEYRIYCSEDSISSLYHMNETYVVIPLDPSKKHFSIEIDKCGDDSIADSKVYHLAVTPVDVAGQENMDVVPTNAVSVSDMQQVPSGVDEGIVKI